MRRNEDHVVLVERDGSSSVVWFLVGGLLGAGLALLYAPQSGARTRRDLGRRVGKLRQAADQALTDLKDAVGPGDRPAGQRAEGDADEEGRAPVSAARRELEQRLAEARARRRKALAEEDEEPVA